MYRSDLGLDGKLSRACQHPDNLWSLHGLHECLVRRGEKVESPLIKQRLDLAQARAEIQIKASCFCRRMDLAGSVADRGGIKSLLPIPSTNETPPGLGGCCGRNL